MQSLEYTERIIRILVVKSKTMDLRQFFTVWAMSMVLVNFVYAVDETEGK